MKHMMRGKNFHTKDLNEWGSNGRDDVAKNICERVSEAVHVEAAKERKEIPWLWVSVRRAMDE